MTRPDGVLHLRDTIKSRCLCQQTISSVSDDNMLGGLSVLAGRWGNYRPELLSQKTMSSEEHRGTNGISVRRLILSPEAQGIVWNRVFYRVLQREFDNGSIFGRSISAPDAVDLQKSASEDNISRDLIRIVCLKWQLALETKPGNSSGDIVVWDRSKTIAIGREGAAAHLVVFFFCRIRRPFLAARQA